MSLKGNWIDKVNGIDNIDASHINDVAHAVIELEEDLLEAVEAGKAIVVTVDGTKLSHTSQEIHAAISEGKLVYRYLWGSTYIPCMRSSPTEAYFVSSTHTTPAVVDGVQYPMASIGIWAIKGNKTETVTVPVANRGYVDTLFGKAMECVGSVTLAVGFEQTTDGDVYKLGNYTTYRPTDEGFDYSENDPIALLKDCDIFKIDLMGYYQSENPDEAIYSMGAIGEMNYFYFNFLGTEERFFINSFLDKHLFDSWRNYGEPTRTEIAITGYKLPTA